MLDIPTKSIKHPWKKVKKALSSLQRGGTTSSCGCGRDSKLNFFEPTNGISWFIIIQNNEDTIHIECCFLCSFSLSNVQCFHLVSTLLLHFWIFIDNTRHRKGTMVSVIRLLWFYSHKYLESGEKKPKWLEMFLRKKVSTLAAPPSPPPPPPSP